MRVAEAEIGVDVACVKVLQSLHGCSTMNGRWTETGADGSMKEKGECSDCACMHVSMHGAAVTASWLQGDERL